MIMRITFRISKYICEKFLCHRIVECTLLTSTHILTWDFQFKNVLQFNGTCMKCNFMHAHRKDTPFSELIF